MKEYYLVEGRCMKSRRFTTLPGARKCLKKTENMYNHGDVYIVKVVDRKRIVVS